MSVLTKAVTNLEEKEKTRNEMLDWVKQQTADVNEWATKPLKLRIDLNATDVTNIQTVIDLLSEKKGQVLELNSAENFELEKELELLEQVVIEN